MQSSPIDISIIPRYKQGDRGTCMACAACSFLGYYFHSHGRDIRLSPQYLYARCKLEEQDGNEGTDLQTAFDMAKTHGICKEEDWPYNPRALPDGCAEDPVTRIIETEPDRLRELTTVRCWEIPFHFLLTPSSVQECKNVLDGIGGWRPMPVVIGCNVFPSVLEKMQHDGWLHWPLPGEDPYLASGHAMLVVGYEDTPDFKLSQGFFWALNSWGPSFHDVQGHEGMVRIPYDYYARYVTAAGTIREKQPEEDASCPRSVGKVPSIASSKKPEGSVIQQQPAAVDMTNLADGFFASLESNLRQPDCPLPYELFDERKPLWSAKKARLGQTKDESERFMGFLRENAPKELALRGTVKTIPLCPKDSFRLAAAVLFHDDATPVAQKDIAFLRNFIAKRCPVPAAHDIIVIATNAFDDGCQPVVSPPVVLCTPMNGNLWDFQLPQTAFSEETIAFLLHVLPGTPKTYAAQLATIIDHWPKDMHITKEGLRQKLNLHSSIPDAFLDHWLNALFARGGYAKDNRGYIYPPDATLPEGHGAQRTKRYA